MSFWMALNPLNVPVLNSILTKRATSKCGTETGKRAINFRQEMDLWSDRLMVSLSEWMLFNAAQYEEGQLVTTVYYLGVSYIIPKAGPIGSPKPKPKSKKNPKLGEMV